MFKISSQEAVHASLQDTVVYDEIHKWNTVTVT